MPTLTAIAPPPPAPHHTTHSPHLLRPSGTAPHHELTTLAPPPPAPHHTTHSPHHHTTKSPHSLRPLRHRNTTPRTHRTRPASSRTATHHALTAHAPPPPVPHHTTNSPHSLRPLRHHTTPRMLVSSTYYSIDYLHSILNLQHDGLATTLNTVAKRTGINV
jgi:hypothetical protein